MSFVARQYQFRLTILLNRLLVDKIFHCNFQCKLSGKHSLGSLCCPKIQNSLVFTGQIKPKLVLTQ